MLAVLVISRRGGLGKANSALGGTTNRQECSSLCSLGGKRWFGGGFLQRSSSDELVDNGEAMKLFYGLRRASSRGCRVKGEKKVARAGNSGGDGSFRKRNWEGEENT